MHDNRTEIILAVTARNEATVIADCLRSILKAARFAEERLPLCWRLVAVLDECTDDTEAIVRCVGSFEVIHSTGGLVEAQRTVANRTPFVIYADADILLDRSALFVLCREMLATPALIVAYPRKAPLRPQRASLLAAALYEYNRLNGFQDTRRYFNGKLFAIRDWRVPALSELCPRLAKLPADGFYRLHDALQIDDIYLSRDILRRHGSDSIREVADAQIYFRPPETFSGMYHTYRRMRREIERLNILFPESIPAHQNRRLNRAALRAAPAREQFLWLCFQLWLRLCMMRYRWEKFYYQHLASDPCPTWPAISETKRPFSNVTAPLA
jgi:glycosyltransferase involved in cell wall biosynthesis